MRTPQELREAIKELLAKQGTNTHQMLKKCGYNTSLVNDLKKGQMPSADKLANIARFLNVSSEFLLGMKTEPPERAQDDDADLLEALRHEFYGDPKMTFTPEDRQALLNLAKTIVQLKSAPAIKR